MSKCTNNNKGKDLELLYKQKHIMDVQKINKSNNLFSIKALDAELDKSAPITVNANGNIITFNIYYKGRYYSHEPPNINIKQPASPNGKAAKANAIMKKYEEVHQSSHNIYWVIESINVTEGGSGYDAIVDKDKVEIEKKNTVQKKIIYNEAKPKYYLLEQKISQCNNLTDRWHNWFTIPYYYLGNNDGRRKIDESDKTRNIFKCYDKCINPYVVNNDNVCENISTFEGGKYRNYIPYDPLAIICILGSYTSAASYVSTDVIIKSNLSGNYYDTIKNIKKENDEDINTVARDYILNSLSQPDSYPSSHPVKTIKADIDSAYLTITTSINAIKTEAENNELKIKTIIKKNVNDFYQLFDKRDKLYISYLNKVKDSTHFKRILYAKNIVYDTTINITDKFLKYLFNYCKFLYFNEKNMFAIRLLNYGIYDKDYISEMIDNPDEIDENKITFTADAVKINYNPVTVKIDTKHKNMFDDYSNAYELYKSFILTYPIILLMSVILSIIIMGCYYYNVIYLFISFINFIYLIVVGFFYFCIVFFACNSFVIQFVVFIISAIYEGIKFIYSKIIRLLGLSIIRFVLFSYLIYALMNNNLVSFIYGIAMYIINTIIYLIFGIISILFYIIYGFIYLKPDVIISSLIIMSIMYVYYKIWFNFDINTLHKASKLNTKIINEHSDSTTIFKSGALKYGIGSSITIARLELYKHSYIMNLYEKAFVNYDEKIKELLKFEKNKILENNNIYIQDQDNKDDIKNEKEDFNNKINIASITRTERRDAEKKLKEFDINSKSPENNESAESAESIKSNRKILDNDVTESNKKESKARGDINPVISINVQKKFDDKISSIKSSIKSKTDKVTNKVSGVTNLLNKLSSGKKITQGDNRV